MSPSSVGSVLANYTAPRALCLPKDCKYASAQLAFWLSTHSTFRNSDVSRGLPSARRRNNCLKSHILSKILLRMWCKPSPLWRNCERKWGKIIFKDLFSCFKNLQSTWRDMTNMLERNTRQRQHIESVPEKDTCVGLVLWLPCCKTLKEIGLCGSSCLLVCSLFKTGFELLVVLLPSPECWAYMPVLIVYSL